MKERITNINTLSALLDRLITERIKLYFFKKDGIDTNIEHQERVITAIKTEISQVFEEVYSRGKYDYIHEKRTYKIDDVVESLETLIQSDILTGEGDRRNLAEIHAERPNIENFIQNHKLIRKANETRAQSKNEIDEKLKNIFNDE